MSAADFLLAPEVQKLLKVVLAQPMEKFTVNELAKAARLDPQEVERTQEHLVKSGIPSLEIMNSLADLGGVDVRLYEPSGAPDPRRMPDRRRKPRLTPTRAAFIELLARYSELGESRTLLVAQKLAYFLQTAGQPLELRFARGRYGPYAHALDKAMELKSGGNSEDWFFLAMTHWQLGSKTEARKWYDRAVEWLEKNAIKDKTQAAELRRFQAEAAKLLSLRKHESEP